MKRKPFIILALAIAVSLISLAPASAKKPLIGAMELEFNLEFGEEGTDVAHSTWVGTVDFEGDVYGMAFVPTAAKDAGKTHHFWEDWLIYPYDPLDPFFEFEDRFSRSSIPMTRLCGGPTPESCRRIASIG